VLETVDAVAGYTTYIDLIRPLIKDKQIVSTAMTKEVDRVSAALDLALSGTACAVISSGDPGVYAMAGLVLEMCRERTIAIGSAEKRRIRIDCSSKWCPVSPPFVPVRRFWGHR
jgi:precorrin-3B methylase